MTGSQRNKRYKDRQRRGIMFAHVEISQTIGESLIAMGYLGETSDPKARGQALLKYFTDRLNKKVTT